MSIWRQNMNPDDYAKKYYYNLPTVDRAITMKLIALPIAFAAMRRCP